MTEKRQKELLDAWYNEICLHADEIDAGGGIWEGIFIGFMIGKGCTIEEATDYDFYTKGYKLEEKAAKVQKTQQNQR